MNISSNRVRLLIVLGRVFSLLWDVSNNSSDLKFPIEYGMNVNRL
jgi:hypothetical protein